MLAQRPSDGPLSRALLGGGGAAANSPASSAKSTSAGLAALLNGATSRSSAGATSSLPKIQLKNAAPPPAPAKDRRQASTRLLTRSLRVLLSRNPSEALPCSLERLYATAEDLVSTGQTETNVKDLYETIKLELERAAGEMARSLRASGSAAGNSVAWLGGLEQAWKGWCESTSLVRDILIPLDRHVVSSHTELLSVFDLALDLFKSRVLEDDELRERAYSGIVEAVDRERTTSDISYRSLHRSLLAMLLKLDSYKPLEERLHSATRDFYSTESAKLLQELSIDAFLTHATKRIEEEVERSSVFFSGDRGQDVNVRIVREELVKKHVDALVAGLPKLLDADDVTALTQLYALLASTASLAPLRSAFSSHLRSTGEAMVDDKAKDDALIDRLLEFKARADGVVRNAFAGDSDLVNAQKDAFETFVNKRGNRVAELIAKFLDVKLKSGNKTMSDSELEHILNEALILFRYTHDKDMFEEFYKRAFAKRLLLNRSASSDAEQSMLLKLKEECGPGFTAKLETMLKDIALSEDIMKAYSTVQEKALAEAGNAPGEGMELYVNVLTQAHWPTYPTVELSIPADMAAAAERFRVFYSSRNSGRRLTWAHTLGNCSIVSRFAKAGEKELHVSLFQAVVLLLFNGEEERLSYEQVKERVGLEDKELRRTLQSLACGKIETRVLRKEPQGREVNDGDVFFVNENLKNERKRVRINQIQMSQTAEEAKDTREKVVFERELVLQAAAVRILKARKQLKHSELLNAVVDAIKERFQIDVAEIKKTFETLIEKEYMERVEGERGVYRYLA